jgi:hypothetical protein
MKKKYKPRPPDCSFRQTANTVPRVSLGHVYLAFANLAGGYVLALITLLAEIIVGKCLRKNEKLAIF